MKKLLFIIIAIFSLHCPGYSMYTQAGIFTDGADLLGKACEEGGSEQTEAAKQRRSAAPVCGLSAK